MPEPVVAAYTIGQTPRPDLVGSLAARFPAIRLEVLGALDGLERDEIPPCPARGYPLETHLADGRRVVVDAWFVQPRLQQQINERHPHVSAHLLMCAGAFPGLLAPPPPVGSPTPATPFIHPFEVAVSAFKRHGFRTLDVMVPFADQAPAAMDKWAGRDFACRAHVLAEKPRHRSLAEWISGLVRGTRAQALVIDYVGLPTQALDDATAALDLPVFDLGRLALDALDDTLDAL
jgi:hypothetical protein